MSQCNFVVTQQFSLRIEEPPCNHFSFHKLFQEITIECDPRSQGFETLLYRPSNDHRRIHHNFRLQTVHGFFQRNSQSGFSRSSFQCTSHAFEFRWCHCYEPASVIEQQEPQVVFPMGQPPLLRLAPFTAPNKSAAHGSPCGTGVMMS